uniref:Uncharacterized protein n=1 Tax=Rhizophora mucronata TaxID=61149 RepID=A0A2P2QRZ9_RHIMU
MKLTVFNCLFLLIKGTLRLSFSSQISITYKMCLA